MHRQVKSTFFFISILIAFNLQTIQAAPSIVPLESQVQMQSDAKRETSPSDTESGTLLFDTDSERAPNACPAGTTSFTFTWDDGSGTGNVWNATDTTNTYTVNYTTAAGDPATMDVTMSIVDPQNRNWDATDLSNSDLRNPNPWGDTAQTCGWADSASSVGDYASAGSLDDPWDSDCSPDSGGVTSGTETDGIFGNPYLTIIQSTVDHTDETDFMFAFSKSVYMDDFSVADIDDTGLVHYTGSGSEDARNEPGDSYQDQVFFSASNGGTNVPVNLSGGSNLTIDSGAQSATAIYDTNASSTLSPNDAAGVATGSTVAPIDSFTLTYSNGPDDAAAEQANTAHYSWWSDTNGATNGASDSHAIRLGGFTFCVEEPPAELTIDKTVSPTGDVEAGDTLDYTIVVENIGGFDAEEVVVTDALPAGVTYVPNSAEVTYNAAASASYTSPNLGPVNVSGTGSTTVSHDTTGLIPAGAQLTNYSFNVAGEAINGSFRNEIDLTATYPGGNAYVLDFGNAPINQPGSSGTYNVSQGPTAVSGSAIGNYTFIFSEDFDDGGTDNAVSNATFTINYTTGGATTQPAGAPPNLITTGDNIDLAPNQSLTITLQATVDTPLAASQFVNSASTFATNVTTPVTDTVTNTVSAPPPLNGSIIGTVEEDTTGDGNGDTPIVGVVLELLTSAGAPVLDGGGQPIIAVTDGTGQYTFSNVPADDYRVREQQPQGYTDVSEVDGGTDADNADNGIVNDIPVTVDPSETDTGNDFVERRLATIGNYVWLDEDGDGDQDAGEDGIAGAIVSLTPPAGIDLGNGAGVAITTTTDANGGYLFRDIPPATGYTVAVESGSLPRGLSDNPTYDEDSGTSSPDSSTVVDLSPNEEHLTADFGYNWASPADTNTPNGSATGAIGDRIWIDSDGDGVQDAGEAGIAGVPVQLFYDGDGDGVADEPYPGGMVTTDEHGNYIFDDLPAGIYNVVVTSPPTGYTQTGDPDDFGAAATNPDNQTTHPIVLAPGDVFVNADFGYQPNSGGSDIGDTIYLDSNGDGNEDAGEDGIAGVTVALLDDSGNVIATTITDDNGNYLFPDLPAGDYQVQVTDTNNVLGELDVTGNPIDDGGAVDNVGSVITVDGNTDNLDQDFGYAPPNHGSGEGLIGDTIFLDIDGNGTLDGNDTGLEGVTVTLTDENGGVATTTTDENGNYYFGNLDPTATYTVTVDTLTLPGGVFISADPDGGSDSISVVNLGAAGTDGVADPDGDNGLNLGQDFGYTADNPATGGTDESNTLSGTIWEDSNADGTLDGSESGRLASVTVALYDTNNGQLLGTTTTDASGNYSFEGLPDGRYIVDVIDDANVLAGMWHSDGPNDGADNNSQDDVYSVDLDSAGASSAGVTDSTADFGYYVDPASSGNFIWDDANGDGVQNNGETGIDGVEVTLEVEYPNGTVITLKTTTGDDPSTLATEMGWYSFENLLADEDYNSDGTGSGGTEPTYTISVATPSGYMPAPVDTMTGGGNDQNDSDAHTGVAATVTQGVIDTTQNSDPTAEANPSASYDFGFMQAGTAVIGNYVWVDENGDGVQDAGESGIPGVVVQLTDSGGNTITTTTDVNGGYLFTDLPAGTYTVTVDTMSMPTGLAANPTFDEDGIGTPHTSGVTVTDGEEHLTADFGYNWSSPSETDTPNGSATGAIGDRIWIDADGDGVQDAGEAGIAGVPVQLFYDGDGDGVADEPYPGGTVTTDEHGNYIFDDLPAGIYNVVVTSPPVGYTQTGDPDDFGAAAANPDNQTTSPIVLAPGDVFVNADFGYQPNSGGSDIGDTIYFDSNGDGDEDAGESGIAGVTVALLDDSGNVIATTITDDNGNYLFPDLPAGDYQVQVTDTDNVLGELDVTGNPIDDGGAIDNIGSVITVDGSTGNLDQDFGYAPLNHGSGDGLIGDTIFLDIDGNGTMDGNDTGLEGVTVTLTDTSGNVVSTTTDENGNYSFGDLDPNATYTVTVNTATLPSGMFISADPDGGSDSISVVNLGAAGTDGVADPDGDNGLNLGQDFGYTADNPATSGTDESNTLSGTIWEDSNADGTLDGSEAERLEGVTIALYDNDGNIIATTATDASGNYTFMGLPDAQYVVDVTDDANVLNGMWHSDGPNDGSDNNSQDDVYSVDLDSANASSAGVTDSTADFGYYVDPASSGNFVWNDANGDGVQNNGETGIDGAEVTLEIEYPNGTMVTLTTTTGDDPSTLAIETGWYSFENLLADEDYNSDGTGSGGSEPTYTISVATPAGYAPSSVDTTASGGNDQNDSDNHNGVAATLTQGVTDTTQNSDPTAEANPSASYDFGFMQTGAAVIGNYVWVDENGDGVQDAGEPGIPNVAVQLIDSSGNIVTTTTDTNGGYLFTDVPAGTYTVTVNTSSMPVGLATNPTFDEDGIGTPHTSEVTVTDGEEHLTADFGYNWSSPSETDTPNSSATGAIGDRVWLDANGDGVQDPGEAGIANISLQLLYDADGDGSADDPYPGGTAFADPSGNYIFDNLPAGIYNVVVTEEPEGTTQTGDPDEFGTVATNPDRRTTSPIVLAPGDVFLNVDFGYQPNSGGSTIGDTIFIDPNGNGTQDDPTSEPGIPGVTVVLLNVNGFPIATDITDENGNYSFPDLPAGTYTVQVTDTENVLGELDPISNPVDDAGPVDNSGSPITVDGTSDNLNQDFGYVPSDHMAGDGVIGDTIFLDIGDGAGGAANGAPDAGEGLEGVTVTLTDASGNITTTQTNENGSYFFGGLDPNETYTVTVDTASLPVGVTNSVDPDGGTASQSVVDLSSGTDGNADPDGVDNGINLGQDFGYVATTPGAVAGTVWEDSDADGSLDEGGSPGIAGVTVDLTDSDGNVVATTVTDSNGDYDFQGLPPGNYIVDVTDRDNVLEGMWHSIGTPDTNNQSQTDPKGVTVVAGQTTDADFGYYDDPSTLGNHVWFDLDFDGIQESGEPGLDGVTVTLQITYPNGVTVTVATVTGDDPATTGVTETGWYSFANLLFDEDYAVGSGGTSANAGEPAYVISAELPTGYSQTILDTTASGTTDLNDADDATGVAATPTQGVNTVSQNSDPTAENNPTATYDFGLLRVELGDLPSAYGTYVADSGARHIIYPDNDGDHMPDLVGAIWLGSIVDPETDGHSGGDFGGSTGDDDDGTDDEDGLILPPQSEIIQGNTVFFTVTLRSRGTQTADYGLWIDWDGNGDFNGASEFHSANDVAINTLVSDDIYEATFTIPVEVPANVVNHPAWIYIRSRVFIANSTVSGRNVDLGAHDGLASNGEVEDYGMRPISPTAVGLRDVSVMTPAATLPLLLAMLAAATVVLLRRRSVD